MGLVYEKRGRIAYMAFNRPEVLNVYDFEQREQFNQALMDFRDDGELWVAIITGTGEKAFCAGADLKQVIPVLMDPKRAQPYESPPTITRGLEIWKPIIAAVNGMALGFGFEVVLACDLRIAAENATFGFPEVRAGIMPGDGGTQRLPRSIPWAKAAEVILLGKSIDAQEAYRLGLINKVVPVDRVLPEAMKWAEEICKCGPLAVRAAKKAMVEGMGMTLAEGLKLDLSLFNSLRFTNDAQEGHRAFAEKRKPVFEGK